VIILPSMRGVLGIQRDPFIANVVNLSHFNGVNGGTTFTNSVGGGNAFGSSNTTTSNVQFKWGPTSCLFNVSNSHATATTDTDYNMGSGDFTVEFWAWMDDTTGAKVFYDQRPGAEGLYPSIYTNGGNTLRYYTNSADRITGTPTMPATTWFFIALSKVSGSTRLYFDGNQVGSTYTDGNTYLQSQVRLGLGGFNTGSMSVGYIDDFRLTKGVGRYAGTTCPIPAGPFPNT
jgi:concanavalin A-like lectin/glucanase superfamily protein